MTHPQPAMPCPAQQLDQQQAMAPSHQAQPEQEQVLPLHAPPQQQQQPLQPQEQQQAPPPHPPQQQEQPQGQLQQLLAAVQSLVRLAEQRGTGAVKVKAILQVSRPILLAAGLGAGDVATQLDVLRHLSPEQLREAADAFVEEALPFVELWLAAGDVGKAGAVLKQQFENVRKQLPAAADEGA